MYGMPQPNTYGQYGFGAYGGFPNQAPASAPGAAAPGMGSPVAPTATTGLGAGQAPGDAAAAQVAQGQWPAADPSSYYSNYWGGESAGGRSRPASFLADVATAGYYSQQAPGTAAPDGQGQA